ncbi:MAG: hypothetical protein ACYC2H_08180 [Thermoplasmatota archaeon]
MAQEKGRDSKDGKDSAAKKGDDYEFIPPDFDEDAFIHKELVSFRTTLILFLWAIVAAAVSWGAFAAMGGAKTGWLVGLGIAALLFLGLKRLFLMLKVDIKHFGRREWLGTGALYFFTWLSFFIIAINPPVSDFAPPRVELHASPLVQETDDRVTIDLFVEDNHAVEAHAFELRHGDEVLATTGDLQDLGRGHYRYEAVGLAPGTYEAVASASDDKGHDGNDSITFAVIEKILQVTLPEGGRMDAATDQVLVKSLSDAYGPCQTKKNRITNVPCVREVAIDLANVPVLASGSVTNADAMSLEDSSQAWPKDAWKGKCVQITTGPGAGQEKRIKANSGTALVLEDDGNKGFNGPLSPIPDVGSAYTISNAGCIRMEYSATFGGWQATSNFAGWVEGNNSFTVVMQMVPTFAGTTKIPGGNVTAGPFELTVDVANNPLGTYVPKVIAEPTAPTRNVPGLELPLLAIGLLVAVLAIRRRDA